MRVEMTYSMTDMHYATLTPTRIEEFHKNYAWELARDLGIKLIELGRPMVVGSFTRTELSTRNHVKDWCISFELTEVWDSQPEPVMPTRRNNRPVRLRDIFPNPEPMAYQFTSSPPLQQTYDWTATINNLHDIAETPINDDLADSVRYAVPVSVDYSPPVPRSRPVERPAPEIDVTPIKPFDKNKQTVKEFVDAHMDEIIEELVGRK